MSHAITSSTSAASIMTSRTHSGPDLHWYLQRSRGGNGVERDLSHITLPPFGSRARVSPILLELLGSPVATQVAHFCLTPLSRRTCLCPSFSPARMCPPYVSSDVGLLALSRAIILPWPLRPERQGCHCTEFLTLADCNCTAVALGGLFSLWLSQVGK